MRLLDSLVLLHSLFSLAVVKANSQDDKLYIDETVGRWHIATKGESVTLKCPVTGTSLVRMSWTQRAGQQLSKANNARYTKRTEPVDSLFFNRGFLDIVDAWPSDSGLYTCTAVNGFNERSAQLYLIVCGEEDCVDSWDIQKQFGLTQFDPAVLRHWYDTHLKLPDQLVIPPTFYGVTNTTQRTVFVGENLYLTCGVYSKPRAKVSWLKGGRYHSRHIPGTHMDRSLHKKERKERVETHRPGEMNYTCSAQNDYSTKYLTYTVKVIQFDPDTRFLTPSPSYQLAVRGSDVNLTCRVQSRTKPLITWLKRIDRFEDEMSGDITVLEGGSSKVLLRPQIYVTSRESDHVRAYTLTLRHVTHKAAGAYYCAMSKPDGYDYHVFNLQVVNNFSEESERREKSRTQTDTDVLWIVISVAVGLLVLVVVVLACVCQRRRMADRHPKHTTRTLNNSYHHWDV